MSEVLYDVPTGLIAGVLLASMLAAVELGHRLGRRRPAAAAATMREHVNAIQSSILGVLALLLGFTFSLALQRYDSRSEAVVEEANAIGTAALRAQWLPAPLRDEVLPLLRDYVDLRVRAGALSSLERSEREGLSRATARAQAALWQRARQAVEAAPGAVAPVSFADSLNTVFDSYGRRDAALARHVPELVLLLLYATFLMAGGIVGYACGVGGHRPSAVSTVMIVLMVVLVFVILDLDRPRRGLITVSERSMIELQGSMREAAAGSPAR